LTRLPSPAHRCFEKFKARLEALSPANPEAYFLLGEEVADQPPTPIRASLAEQFVRPGI